MEHLKYNGENRLHKLVDIALGTVDAAPQSIPNVEVQLEVGHIVHLAQTSEKLSLDIIHAIDLAHEDAGFTMRAIKELVYSLCNDMNEGEMKDFVKDLKKLVKNRFNEGGATC